MENFISLLRTPDFVLGATENSPFRFEEKAEWQSCSIKYDYQVQSDSAKITVYPSGSPVRFLKLRFNGDCLFVDKVYGDQIERAGDTYYLEWRSVMPHRMMAWYFIVKGKDCYKGYGVKTGADCFAYWQIDARGITLFLNLCNGNNGTNLQAPLLACEVVEYAGKVGENAYSVHKNLCKKMCDCPVLPKSPIFGVNNWYWAYGNISKDGVLKETDYLMEMTDGVKNRPSMIIDDGWQLNRSFAPHNYIGGPWEANSQFKDMALTASLIKEKGASDADVIGCNTIGHLCAGIHSISRTGNDTSGRSFEWTRRFGVHSMMRLPQNETFFLVDPDCAAFTERVDSKLNLDYLEACAITGMTTLASVTPHSLTKDELKQINRIYKIADENKLRFTIDNYDKTANPDTFISPDGKIKKLTIGIEHTTVLEYCLTGLIKTKIPASCGNF